jgi:transcriptional regulator with XRE-family HTH domain
VGSEGLESALRRLSRNIRSRRLELDLTQEAVAFDAGLSPRHFQELESGTANPTFATLFEIARVLNSSVAELATTARRPLPQRRRASKS